MKLRSLQKIGREILVNVALPFLIYSLAKPQVGEVYALIASSAPPLLWIAAEFARHRKVDALSLLVLLGLGLSLLAFFGGGSARFLQLRERLVTVFVGLVFLGSAAVGKPLMHELVRAFLARSNDTESRRVESLRDDKFFKAGMTFMTVVWGAGLLADAAVSVALLFVLPVSAYLVVNPILGYATIGSLTLWNVWFGRRMRRKGEAIMAARTASASPEN
jgi:hypothetical protein